MERQNLNLPELCRILKIGEKAPVFFDQKSPFKVYSIFTRCVPDALATDADNGCYDPDKKYDRSECGIHILNMSVDDFMTLQFKGNPESVSFLMQNVIEVMGTQFQADDYNMIYAVFCILHELGHWLEYKKMELNDVEFHLREKTDREEVMSQVNQLRQMPEGFEKHKFALDLNAKYRKVPGEKAADAYALAHIVEAVKIVRES